MKLRCKKLSGSGQITIPKDMRFATGIRNNMAVDIEQVEGGILIRQHTRACRFCGSIESIGTIKGEPVCPKCAKEVYEEVRENYAV